MKTFRRPELEGDGSARRLENPRLKIREVDPADLVLSAQCHVRWNESTLYRVRDTPYRLDVGSEGQGHEEAELGTDQGQRAPGGCGFAARSK